MIFKNKYKNFLTAVKEDIKEDSFYKIIFVGLYISILFLMAILGIELIMFPMLAILCVYAVYKDVRVWWLKKGKELWKKSKN